MIIRREFFKRKREEFERFIVDVIYDRKKTGKFLKVLKLTLNLFSCVFELCVKLRLLLYKNNIFKSHPLGCLVIVVGNLTVGGTGKTPVVEQLAKALKKKGRKVAILSRGYKSKRESLFRVFFRWISHKPPMPPKIVSDGTSIFLDSETSGDEPYMLAKNLPGTVVLVDKDRVKSGNFAIRKFGVDTLILDDGFQYLRLKGALNILLIDKTNPFGNRKFLPLGILRDQLNRLKDASYILLTKSNGSRDLCLENSIRKYNSKAHLIECMHKPKYLRAINNSNESKKIISLDKLKGIKVASLTGIAMPESFENFLIENGSEIVYKKRFTDHYRFCESDLNEFFDESIRNSAQMVLTTEKDAVRVQKTFENKLPFYFLRLEIEILFGKNLSDTVSKICFPKN